MRHSLNIIYLTGLAFLVWAAIFYETLSNGLANAARGSTFYFRTLLSSGGDDDVVVFGLILFALPLVFRLTRQKHPAGRFEILLFLIVTAVV